MNPFRISRVLGWVLISLGGLMLFPLLVSLAYPGEGDRPALLGSALLTAATGGLAVLVALRRGHGELSSRESFVVVAFSWLLMALFGTLPFLLSGQIPHFVDALFESMSGFTTTGASILGHPEGLTHGVGMWRCFTHWIGGLGIVLFTLILLPMLGAGGLSLFRAEATGPIAEKLTPRLKDTARILYLIYILLTVACALLLWAFGMDFYDSWAHSFGTIATGGFSTKDTSIAWYASPAIHITITAFMVLSGINFALYHLLVRRRDWRGVLGDSDLRLYLTLFFGFSLAIALVLVLQQGWSVGHALLGSAFQVGSLMTCTGFATENFDLWPSFARMSLVGLMVVGGMAGSTAGGIKTVRFGMILAMLRQSLRRTFQPRAVTPIRFNRRAVSPDLMLDVLACVTFYFATWGVSSLLLGWMGSPFDEAAAGVVACLSNAGPGLGRVGPAGNFSCLSDAGTLLLTADMLLGRLEFLTILVLFSRHFWRR
ncbi:MAG: TrkH family potassium uptake protein [Candidatus Delongbacteria bacterium]